MLQPLDLLAALRIIVETCPAKVRVESRKSGTAATQERCQATCLVASCIGVLQLPAVAELVLLWATRFFDDIRADTSLYEALRAWMQTVQASNHAQAWLALEVVTSLQLQRDKANASQWNSTRVGKGMSSHLHQVGFNARQ